VAAAAAGDADPQTASIPRSAELEPWLRDQVQGVRLPLDRIEMLASGRSNLTYVLTDAAGSRYVLRRPPHATPPGAGHDVLREARVVHGLEPTGLPLPRVLATCEDPAVIGAPFYVMTYVAGTVLTQPEDAAELGLTTDPERARVMATRVVESLRAVHAVDLDEVGLGGLRRRGSYVARQVKRLGASVEGLPDSLDKVRALALRERLLALAPEEQRVTLLHGDYKLGNLMLAADGSIAAILDWELCSTGDPLADIGWLIASWAQPDDGPWLVPPATSSGGFPDRAALISRFPEGGSESLDFYVAFAYWRWSAINLGTRRRVESGQSGAPLDLAALDAQVDWQLGRVAELLDR
jgi:aminoglycoside phosphotransferase (APT) family kinase protein